MPLKRIASLSLLCIVFAAFAGYCGTYAYYRYINDDGVLVYVGSYGSICIGESFSGESLVTQLSEMTGLSIAPGANRIFTPLARMDQIFTGRFIRFNDHVTQPIFQTRTHTHIFGESLKKRNEFESDE